MKKSRRIDFESYDGRVQARIGHGHLCVALMIDHAEGGIVLDPDEAEALGKSLVRQARYARGTKRDAR